VVPGRLALGLAAGGIGLFVWLEFGATPFEESLRKNLLFVPFALLAPAFHWAVQSRWFELTDTELRSYKGERLLRAWALSQVSRVEADRGAYYVVFADGSRVAITGEGGDELLDALRDHVRRVSPSTDSAGLDPHVRSLVLRHVSAARGRRRAGASRRRAGSRSLTRPR